MAATFGVSFCHPNAHHPILMLKKELQKCACKCIFGVYFHHCFFFSSLFKLVYAYRLLSQYHHQVKGFHLFQPLNPFPKQFFLVSNIFSPLTPSLHFVLVCPYNKKKTKRKARQYYKKLSNQHMITVDKILCERCKNNNV